MATRGTADDGDKGCISKFFQVQAKKKRSLNEISNVCKSPEPTKNDIPLSQNSSQPIPIDEETSPEKSRAHDDDVPFILSSDNTTEHVEQVSKKLSITAKTEEIPNRVSLGGEEIDGRTGATREAVGACKDDTNSPPANSTTTPPEENPFAQFAFQLDSSNASNVPDPEALPNINWKRKERDEESSNKLRHGQSLPKKPLRTEKSSSDSSGHVNGSGSNKKAKSDWVRMADLSCQEQQKIKRKWQSLANPDVPLEVRRFQVLVAARLHARCQEPVVRKAMHSLCEVFEAIDKSQGLCVATVSQADPEVLANVISSIQYYNVKARHIVKAAQEIQSRFGGKVPESEHSLRQLTGIGPVMADLLAFVNTRAAYTINTDSGTNDEK